MQISLKQYRSLLITYLNPQRNDVLGLIVTLLSSIGFQILNPQLLGYFIDTAIAGGSTQTLMITALLFIGVAFLVQILTVSATYLGENIAWKATNAMRADLLEHCLRLDLSFHKSRTPGELLERIDGDVTILARFFSQLTIHVLGNGILLVGILVVLFLEDWRAGLSLSLFSAISLAFLLRLHPFAVLPWATYRQMGAEFFGFLAEHLTGREDIRANGAVNYVVHQFHQILRHWLPAYQKARFASTVLWATSVGLFTTGNAVALAIAAYLWNQNAITIGTAYLIFYYTNLLSQPIERIREELEELQQVEASIYRIQELFNTRSNLSDVGNAFLPLKAFSVSFKNISFCYESNEEKHPKETSPLLALQNISFHLPAGQILGLVGQTGSGKSTIACLLLRFYDVQSGEIFLDNVPINQISLSELRQHIGLVTQDVQLFQASIRDNLTFFNPYIQDAVLLKTIHELGLSDWFNSLPDGLDTPLGADSNGLSAGQAQLLTFARVFLKNPGLVILDEAASRLDPATETQIERATNQLLHHRTGIIIAHRLRTVQRADQILILDQGTIVEYGNRLMLQNDEQSRFSQLLRAANRD